MVSNSFFLSIKPVLSQKRCKNEENKYPAHPDNLPDRLQKSTDTTSITGEIKGLGDDTIYLYGIDGLYQHIDTIYVKGDKFSHSLKVDTITTAMLLLKGETEYPIFLDKKEKIKVQGNANNLDHLNIEGNIYNEEFSAFQATLQGPAIPSEKCSKQKQKNLSASTTILSSAFICWTSILYKRKLLTLKR